MTKYDVLEVAEPLNTPEANYQTIKENLEHKHKIIDSLLR